MDQAVHAAVTAVYAAAADIELWPQALQAIADSLGDAGAILIYGRDDGRFGIVASTGLLAMVEEYARDWSHRDIRAIRARERGYFLTRDVITDRDLLSEAEMASDPQYLEFLAAHGLRYFAAASVSPDPHVEVALSIQRRADRLAYDEDELELVGHLSRHVENALRLGVRLLDAELLNRSLGDALEASATGAFGLDGKGQVLFANGAGRAMLGDGLRLLRGRVEAEAPEDRRALASAIRQVAAGEADGLATASRPWLLRRRAGRALVAYLAPLPTEPGSAADLFASVRVMLLVRDPDREGAVDPTVLRDVLGLTLGEARVAALVGAGAPPREAAQRLGITEQTLRTVLKRVFLKAGVSRQSELAALVARLQSPSGPPPATLA